MNIPTIPTDNLYKFMALTGVVLVIGSFILVWFKAERSQELLREYKQGAALIEAKIEIAELSDLLDQESRKRIGKSSELRREVGVDRAKLVVIEEELKLILEDKLMYMVFLIVSQVVGFSLSIVGFKLWYERVQKYQDIILRRQGTSEVEAGPS